LLRYTLSSLHCFVFNPKPKKNKLCQEFVFWFSMFFTSIIDIGDCFTILVCQFIAKKLKELLHCWWKVFSLLYKSFYTFRFCQYWFLFYIL
jgi:hypothetical protein